jgi:hypothetical protein
MNLDFDENLTETLTPPLRQCHTSTLPFVDNRPYGRLEEVSTILLFYSLSPEDPFHEPAPPMKLVRRDSLLHALLQSLLLVETTLAVRIPVPSASLELFPVHFHTPEHCPSPRRQALVAR